MHEDQKDDTRQLIEHAVRQALEANMPQLQSQIARQVLESLPVPTSDPPAVSHGNANGLVNAVSKIHAGSTQKEILRALLDSGGAYCARIALFVVKAGAASGWQSRGFPNDESVKDFPLDLNAIPVAHCYQNRVATPGNIAEMGSPFIDHFGAPVNEQVLVLPLALKEKVAALVYADAGDNGRLDSDALQLLVMATSAWLEVSSLRKHAAKEDGASGRVESSVESSIESSIERPVGRSTTPVQTLSSFSDPFAGHTPQHIHAIPPEPQPATEVVEVAAHASGAAAAPAVAADPLAGLSPEDADVHRKAQRFVRLLVDEIKLYNQAKVAEGRRNKDLYDRLKEDIDKSRGTFQKRYGSTAAANVDYFQQELLRSLAEDDVSIMGPNFRR
jgi:hypothetical protein